MNKEFLDYMKDLLNEEYETYEELLKEKAFSGIRINTTRISEEDFLKNTNLKLEKSPFAKNGYYIQKEEGLGYSDEHMLNLFYIQEPSASSAVTILNPMKHSKVLDICASPGSKSTQILEMLDNTGLLVVNETINNRVNALKENIKKYAHQNTVIINDHTSNIAKELEGVFDYVLCDAPCSGEGMFRKSNEAIKQHSMAYVQKCRELQEEIIENAWNTLKEGGYLVYSTCTLNKIENEELIEYFLNKHPEAELVPIEASFGRKSFKIGEYGYALRIYPMDKGEGHFVAKLKKKEGYFNELKVLKNTNIDPLAKSFIKDMIEEDNYYYFQKDNKVYMGINPFYDFNLHLIQNQTLVGEIKKNRFEPSHEFLSSNYLKYKNIIEIDKEELNKYYHGEIINRSYPKGWYVLVYNNIRVGGVKSDGKTLKKHYPKELRRNY